MLLPVIWTWTEFIQFRYIKCEGEIIYDKLITNWSNINYCVWWNY